jgi:hypothetical protein
MGAQLLGRLYELFGCVELDLLEADPGAPRLAAGPKGWPGGIPLWGNPVRDREDDWLIVWDWDGEQEDLIVVRYLGPAPS